MIVSFYVMENLKNFHNYLNSLHPDIYFPIEIGEKHLPFLDVLLEKNGTDLSTDIFFKETDTVIWLVPGKVTLHNDFQITGWWTLDFLADTEY